MPSSATITSTFNIIIDQGIPTSPAVLTVVNTRPLKVTSMLVTGLNGAVVTMGKNLIGNTVATSFVVATQLNDFPSTIVVANDEFSATDTFVVSELNGVNATRVILVCSAVNPQTIVVDE